MRLILQSCTVWTRWFTKLLSSIWSKNKAYVSDERAAMVIVLKHLHAQVQMPRDVVTYHVTRPRVAALTAVDVATVT